MMGRSCFSEREEASEKQDSELNTKKKSGMN
jgi:hypothetical protein